MVGVQWGISGMVATWRGTRDGSPALAIFLSSLYFLLGAFAAEGATISVILGATPTPASVSSEAAAVVIPAPSTVGTIQDALEVVTPGDTIEIYPGEYYEDLKTRVHGTTESRITIRAQGGEANKDDVILHGAGESTRVFELNHDFYTLEYFTIDGKILEDVNDDNYLEGYRDKLLYISGIQEKYMRSGGYLSALDGPIIRGMTIKNAGGECIRLRYYVTNALMYDNVIDGCGIHDFSFDQGGKNGEGIYIGTAVSQWDDGKNPTGEPDVCRDNLVRGNFISTQGNEGVDIKEGSINNIVEFNEIYLQLDYNSGGVDVRGDGNIIRYNHIQDAAGAGIRLGGHDEDGVQYGLDNQVYGNTLVDCRSFGLKIMEGPQAYVCGNTILLPPGEDEEDYQFTGGDYSGYDAQEDCPFELEGTSPPMGTLAPGPVPEPGTLIPTPSRQPTPGPMPRFGGTALGCYSDRRARTMSFGFRDTRTMTTPDCMEYCLGIGHKYAGLQYAIECWCSSDNNFKNYGAADNCNMACPGDTTTICGGTWAQNVYKI